MAEFLLKQDVTSRNRFDFERSGSWFFFVSIFIFILALGGLGILMLLNKSRAATRDEIIAQNQSKEESLRPELLQQVSVLEKRLKNVRTLLGTHGFTSNVIKVLEQDTHPQVRFSNFVFAVDSRKVDMSGEASSYSVLSSQIGIFERDSQVERVDFGGLSTADAKFVGFKISITFKPTLLGIRP